ncbi:SRPBCC family protein [Candidatus Nitrotoga arctica]|uniref:Activator of Hsp90 ATPase homologue 1/2-like C-terminal domain-containing protein n=1 Tax=Candidatus Nitrotoga arctica TaxID=453162 RepID=A0ABN8ANF9_9PROT|nr:SRPBCC family protein [Candidatus Nitrotoga arctica]CAG9932726.1 conserved protein of unknown function [Candidatus Nitrotoga arctica]
MSAVAPEKSNEIVITRTVRAPIQRVWQMFTRPEHIQHWWGPNGFTNTIFEMDVRVGGLWRYIMHAPANADGSPGINYNNWIRYTTITEPTFMAYEHGGDDPDHAEFNTTVTLQDLGDQTQVTLRIILESEAQRKALAEFGAIEGGQQTLARLDAYLTTTGKPNELIITRTFDAPRELVWKAWTDPKHALNWWGPSHHPAVNVMWDARSGARWRNCLRSVETGDLLWHGGEFREVVEPELLAFTFAWEETGERGIENLITITLTENHEKTTMVLRQTPFQSLFEQEGHNEGWNSTFDRLADYLAQRLNHIQPK